MSRPRPFRRLAAAVLALALGLYLGGFLLFAARLDRAPLEPVKADGGVVLTGGPGRIEAAIGLLRAGQVERVLITGVNRDVSAAALARAHGIEPEWIACCIDLDFGALNTRGNARAAARWARQQGFDSLVIVTNDNHMPRARHLIEHVLPNVAIIALPVPTAAGLWVLFKEYSKYFWTLLTPAPSAEPA